MNIKSVLSLLAAAMLAGCASVGGFTTNQLPGVQIIRLSESSYAGLDISSGKIPPAAVRELKHLASLGDVDAEYDLGAVRYVQKRYDQAFKWFSAAAASGHALAQFNTGIMLYRGLGTERDYKRAFQWFERSAKLGDPQSQFAVASLYFDGKGVKIDRAAGIHWYHESAKHRYPYAAYDLGALYYNGNGLPRDHVRAYAWFSVADHWGLNTWQARVILTQTLSPAELTRAKQLGRKLIDKYDSRY